MEIRAGSSKQSFFLLTRPARPSREFPSKPIFLRRGACLTGPNPPP
jgi:hypothetical protein